MDQNTFCTVFCELLEQNGLSRFATPAHAARFYALTTRMLEVNEHMNLTAIKDPRAVILRHYADSLSVEALLPEGAAVADIGCGAGFPSLPLAIVRPDLHILSLDSTAKRIRYVDETAKLLGCTDIEAVAMRAEEAAADRYREKFDVCTARAVAALPVLAELCLPFVRIGGKFLAMKAKRGEEEWESAKNAVARLGGRLVARHSLTLRDGEERDERIIFEFEKIKPTPANLPRPYAKILKSPL